MKRARRVERYVSKVKVLGSKKIENVEVVIEKDKRVGRLTEFQRREAQNRVGFFLY